MYNYFVYILASDRNGTIYTGVTSNLIKRVSEHRLKVRKSFTSKYNVDKLVYYEVFGDIEPAIRREKCIKHYVRKWKLNLIESQNPNWDDLYNTITGHTGSSEQVRG